jgi:hypothetical protein
LLKAKRGCWFINERRRQLVWITKTQANRQERDEHEKDAEWN